MCAEKIPVNRGNKAVVIRIEHPGGHVVALPVIQLHSRRVEHVEPKQFRLIVQRIAGLFRLQFFEPHFGHTADAENLACPGGLEQVAHH